MRRSIIIVSGLAIMLAGGKMFLHFTFDWPIDKPEPSVWIQLVIPVVIVLVGLSLVAYGVLAENIYNIKAGTVVDHNFVASHSVPQQIIPTTNLINGVATTSMTIIPGYQVPDTWSLKIEDADGHTGWLGFTTNIFDQYPIGSYYRQE